MKCEKAIQNINQYFNGFVGELDIETIHHLESCRNCNMHFLAYQKSDELIKKVSDFEPVLVHPSGLTNDIMGALTDTDAASKNEKKLRPIRLFQNTIFRWSLSAAAIILFATFAFEQYLVLDKVNHLEEQYKNFTVNKTVGKGLGTFSLWEIRVIRNYYYAKTNNKELFEKINSMAHNISSSLQ